MTKKLILSEEGHRSHSTEVDNMTTVTYFNNSKAYCELEQNQPARTIFQSYMKTIKQPH